MGIIFGELYSENYLLRIMSGNDLVMYITLHGKVEIYRDTGVSKNVMKDE